MFLHNFATIGLPVCNELIGQAVDTNESGVIEKLARKSGILVCCFAGKTQLSRVRDAELLVTAFNKLFAPFSWI
jgi:hypothetical protein